MTENGNANHQEKGQLEKNHQSKTEHSSEVVSEQTDLEGDASENGHTDHQEEGHVEKNQQSETENSPEGVQSEDSQVRTNRPGR